MKQTFNTLDELNASIDEKTLSFKRLIDYLRKDQFKTFTSVRELPLKKIYDECGIVNDFNTRGLITKALEQMNFLECEGNYSGRKYRLKENEFFKDSSVLANDLAGFLYNNRRRQPYRYRHPKTADSLSAIKKEHSSSAISAKKIYALGDKVFLMKDDKIVLGKIITLKYETFTQISEDYPRIQLPVTINFDKIICSVSLPDNSIHSISTCNVFPDIELLLKSLQVKFLKSGI